MGGGLMALGSRLMGSAWASTRFRISRVNFSELAATKLERIKMGEIIAGTPGLSQFA